MPFNDGTTTIFGHKEAQKSADMIATVMLVTLYWWLYGGDSFKIAETSCCYFLFMLVTY